ncbi:carbohydrate ABC transporter membrane protein 1, CUT1 family [Agrococcus jejuensis]|uniref:Maltose/maltodextrin transport system permease protein n=1 Tax=Agrococcus jejuensis TaxID=399736 RepID=A0A1G8EZA8_9MICO|nr:ABC transporter permease subunit [Agrococcus jejuensis]SDH75192.1 carbohydrate ABC transporter membrane protein 1, CUT1 family [Agrococcus jejuensis]
MAAPDTTGLVRPRRLSGSLGLLAKIALLAVVDAIAVFAVMLLAAQGNWVVVAVVALVTVVVNVVYLVPGRFLPAKYLTPGLVLLGIFQVFVVLFSCYIAFTNYGFGHNSTKDDAISQLIQQSTSRVEDSPAYRVTVVENLSGLGLLVTDPDGDVSVGSAEQPLQRLDEGQVETEAGVAVAADGWTTLTTGQIVQRQSDIASLQVPFSDDLDDGFLVTADARNAYVFVSNLSYDEATDTLTDTDTGVVYVDGGEGAFVSPDGEELRPGWQVLVGFENFAYPFQSQAFGQALIGVTIWTFAFAAISVGLSFLLGLALAVTLNDPRLRGRNVYRVLAILPYAFPSFLSALVWLGLLNTEFGFVNQVLLGGADVPWLSDPIIAKISVIVVNVWLGFPYMFLVCTGALQSIPEEVTEAATVDGARGWAIFRLIKLPLLLVSIAPLLISSFAFNFNNFNIIYMLTRGGPRIGGIDENVGHTDLLITLVYKVAFAGQGADYGLASALAIIIFVIVAVISAISFRQTKALEDLN